MGKRLFSMLGLLGCMGLLLLRSQEAAQAVREALLLCIQSVIPALFPFFVLSGLFISLGCAEIIGTAFAAPVRALLGCSDMGATAFFLGIVGGYPVGGRTVADLRRSGRCSSQEAAHLLAFCNNAGPAFILGIAGSSCFHDGRCGLWLYLIHVSAAVFTGMILGRSQTPDIPHSLGEIPSFPAAFIRAIGDGAAGMLQISGFLVFFQVILRLFSTFTGIHHPLVLGFMELTSGILELPATAQGFIWAAGMLGWGSVSVHCQTAAMLSGTDISMRRYLVGKLLQSAISMVLALPVSHLLF